MNVIISFNPVFVRCFNASIVHRHLASYRLVQFVPDVIHPMVALRDCRVLLAVIKFLQVRLARVFLVRVNKSSYYANTASVAQRAVEFADALVNELNKSKEG